MQGNTHKIIVKSMPVNRSVDDVLDFFEGPKGMKIGGRVNSGKGSAGWWTSLTSLKSSS